MAPISDLRYVDIAVRASDAGLGWIDIAPTRVEDHLCILPILCLQGVIVAKSSNKLLPYITQGWI